MNPELIRRANQHLADIDAELGPESFLNGIPDLEARVLQSRCPDPNHNNDADGIPNNRGCGNMGCWKYTGPPAIDTELVDEVFVPLQRIALNRMSDTELRRLARRCWPKEQHASQKKAEAQMRSLLKRGLEKDETKLHAYECPDCGSWHVGHGEVR